MLVKNIPSLKYYAFDWDDNIVHMPTKIIVVTEDGEEVGMGTDDFAKYRHIIGSEDFEYMGNIIVGYADRPFRNFKEEGNKQFLLDAMMASTGPSWNDFVECINNGSIFGIITARGHDPNFIKEGVYNYIVSNYNGIDRSELVKNLIKYREIAGKEKLNDIELIRHYLGKCKFYPVTNGQGSAANPEDLKVKALKDYIEYVKQVATSLKQKPLFKNLVSNNFIPTIIGFSDDDESNLEKIKSEIGNKEGLKIFSTKGGEKSEF